MKLPFHKSDPSGDNGDVAPAFFFEPQRRVPMLSRGWRTPDPSPTRDAAGLPRCAPSEIFYGAVQGAKNEEQTTPRHRHGTADQKPCTTTEARMPSSPPMRLEIVPVPEKELEPTEVALQKAHSFNDDEGIVQRYISPTSSDSAVNDSCAMHIPMCSPCSIPMVMFPVISTGVMPGTFPEKVCDPAIVSAGSAGHPNTCGEPCKYWSKKKGCKDGAKCDHCHFCDWKPVHGRKNKKKKDLPQ